MSKALIGLLVLVIAALALGGGYSVYQRLQEARAQGQALKQLIRLPLPDASGVPRSLAEWQGRVLVINFWATWCAPCREEVPALIGVRNRFGPQALEVVGIAIDSVVKVQEFAAEFAIPYPLLIGGLEVIDLSRRLGNRAGALPYTLVLDRRGRVVFAHLGALSEEQLEGTVRPLLGTPLSRAVEYPLNSVN
jgi:thiol-disulfide isomerase/thioredoxin